MKIILPIRQRSVCVPAARKRSDGSPMRDTGLSLHPIIHLNEDEVTAYTGCETISHAALRLYEKSKELVIVTCGERGAYYTEGSTGILIEGYKN